MTQQIPNSEILFPLNRFYEQEGLPLPVVRQVPSAQIPQPYRGMLDHDRDMTPTLELFYRETIAIRIIHKGRDGDSYTREVVLYTEGTRRPVSYGSIDIHLENVSEPARSDILSGHLPFGSILHKHALPHVSAPSAFFEIEADAATQKHFGMTHAELLYGRRNRLSTKDGRTLADIVEILAPVG